MTSYFSLPTFITVILAILAVYFGMKWLMPAPKAAATVTTTTGA